MKEQIDMLQFEKEYISQGKRFVAGIDEAGRGPLAGPVVVASVIMPMDNIIEGINDSKKLSEKKRNELFEKIKQTAISYHIEVVDDECKPVKPGVVGENVVNTEKGKPLALFAGYFLDEEKTKAVWHDGYYHTGDTAWKDEDG